MNICKNVIAKYENEELWLKDTLLLQSKSHLDMDRLEKQFSV